jgi:mannose-6-phosphate isomerase-like protein (cupin superfamily)
MPPQISNSIMPFIRKYDMMSPLNHLPKYMKGYSGNIEKDTVENENFRKVLYTGKHCQLVLMSLKPNEEIGMEVHADNDQFFRFEKGQGKVIIDGNEYIVQDGSAIIVPSGAQHNVINTSPADGLKLYTIYSPAHHKDGIIRATKADAEANEEEFEGVTTE